MANHGSRFVDLCNAARERVQECTVADVAGRQEKGESFLLFDVREESEWANGHLPQAEHMGKGVIERDIEKRVPDLDTEMVLYCGGGYRSALAADNLKQMGYTNVISMDGGFRGWKEAGHEIVKG